MTSLCELFWTAMMIAGWGCYLNVKAIEELDMQLLWVIFWMVIFHSTHPEITRILIINN